MHVAIECIWKYYKVLIIQLAAAKDGDQQDMGRLYDCYQSSAFCMQRI